MTPRLFVTGIAGLLGSNIAWHSRGRFAVSGAFHRHPIRIERIDAARLDLEDLTALRARLVEVHPDIVIHTAGLTNVDACEADPDLARRMNVGLARNVAMAARAVSATLIHVSTDHLFAGERPLVEESEEPRPLNVYGRTKADAEMAVADLAPDALIVRTNFFGWGTSIRSSLSDWVLDSLAERRVVGMFTDVHFTPIVISSLVDAILTLATQRVGGILNVAGSERLSKYDFGRRLALEFGYPESLVQRRTVSDAGLVASRPRDMSLDTSKAAALLGRPLPTVAESAAVLRRQRDAGWRLALQSALNAGIDAHGEPER